MPYQAHQDTEQKTPDTKAQHKADTTYIRSCRPRQHVPAKARIEEISDAPSQMAIAAPHTRGVDLSRRRVHTLSVSITTTAIIIASTASPCGLVVAQTRRATLAIGVPVSRRECSVDVSLPIVEVFVIVFRYIVGVAERTGATSSHPAGGRHRGAGPGISGQRVMGTVALLQQPGQGRVLSSVVTTTQ